MNSGKREIIVEPLKKLFIKMDKMTKKEKIIKSYKKSLLQKYIKSTNKNPCIETKMVILYQTKKQKIIYKKE